MYKEVLAKYLHVSPDDITKNEDCYDYNEDCYQVLSKKEADQYLIDEENWESEEYSVNLDKICSGINTYIDWEQYWIDSGLSIIDFDFKEFYYNNKDWYIRKL